MYFEGEKGLVATGLLGFLLAIYCAIWVIVHGGAVAPDGDIAKALSFNAALGIFLLSTAAILPFSAMGPKSRALFRWSYIGLALFSYFAENVQHFRGVNPRFVKNGSAFDQFVSTGFVLVAMLLVLFYVFLAIQYFRKRSYERHPIIVLSIRYAMIAVMISFFAGIWISVNEGRYYGLEGNIIWLHGLGFHALQLLPFVAWLTVRKSQTSMARHSYIHITGLAFLMGICLIGMQTLLGSSIYTLELLPLLACCCFGVCLLPLIVLLRRV